MTANALAQSSIDMRLYKLDCGNIKILDANILDTSNSYAGAVTLKSSCYVIKHGEDYMLWEAGFNPQAIEKSSEEDMFQPFIRETIPQALEKIDLKPEDITKIGISNMHFDNIGQANLFSHATLYMGWEDYNFLFNVPLLPQGFHPEFIDEWADGKNVVIVKDKTDIFGDGRVVMIPTPGHTLGHNSLLVNLEKSGSYLLSGDLWHVQENMENNRVPDFSKNPTLNRQTGERVKNWAENNNVKVIIQHDPRHFEEIPDLPEFLD
ncbi:MAG: N-acyl homoserine lactonase family protein [Alphaproteobacteria bacterium]